MNTSIIVCWSRLENKNITSRIHFHAHSTSHRPTIYPTNHPTYPFTTIQKLCIKKTYFKASYLTSIQSKFSFLVLLSCLFGGIVPATYLCSPSLTYHLRQTNKHVKTNTMKQRNKIFAYVLVACKHRKEERKNTHINKHFMCIKRIQNLIYVYTTLSVFLPHDMNLIYNVLQGYQVTQQILKSKMIFIFYTKFFTNSNKYQRTLPNCICNTKTRQPKVYGSD